MSLGQTFEEKYVNFFKFFNTNHSIKEIKDFININKIPTNASCMRIHLNMIDSQNLNILFYIIINSVTDDDCFQKLKLLVVR